MKVIVDENIPRMTVINLRELGYDVSDIRGTEQQGIADDILWRKAQLENRILITTDKGFSAHRNEFHYGLLIIRLKQPNRSKIHQRVLHAMKTYSKEEWPQLMVIMRDSFQSTWKSSSQQ